MPLKQEVQRAARNTQRAVEHVARQTYEQLSQGNDYKRVAAKLKAIDLSAATLAAVATAQTNGFSHRDTIGFYGALLLAVLTFFIVEGCVFTLNDGLHTTFKGGAQRTLATLTIWLIRATMILNGAALCCWIAARPCPVWLTTWTSWAFAFHLGVALIAIPLIRQFDPVVAHRMLELKAETAREDLIVIRRAAAIGGTLASGAARVRGLFDQVGVAWNLLISNQGFGKKFVAEMNKIAAERYTATGGTRRDEWPDDLGDADPKSKRR